jgi:NADPH:quinone reductase-like Zn-dependent oxidoreductase
VALFAAQFAKVSGARVLAITSSDARAQLLRQLGVDTVINYRQTPAWSKSVLEETGGNGVDIVVETAGSTLPESLAATAFGGFIGVIGFLGGSTVPLNIRQLIGPMVRMQGIVVGSRAHLEAVIRLMSLHQIKPTIDSEIPLAQAADGFTRMQRAEHTGKIVITL